MANEQHDFNDEYEGYEGRLPSMLGKLLSTVIMDISHAEYSNRINYAKVMVYILRHEAVVWAMQAGVLTLSQGLSAMNTTPFIEWVNRDYFGVKKANFDAEFRIAASRLNNEKTQLGIDTKTHTEGKIGGFLGIFGGGGFSLDAGTTYRRDTGMEHKASREATIKVDVEMESMPPPELVSYLSDEAVEMTKGSVDISKVIIEKQKNLMADEANDADVPKGLPDDVWGKKDDIFGGPQENSQQGPEVPDLNSGLGDSEN